MKTHVIIKKTTLDIIPYEDDRPTKFKMHNNTLTYSTNDN